MNIVVVDASAGVEMLARTSTGVRTAELVPAGATMWVPDGVFDVEVLAVLRRWDLNAVLNPQQIEASLHRLVTWRLRRASVTTVRERAWQLRKNLTFSDACYVALAEALDAPLLTCDRKLVDAPNLATPTLHL